MHWFNNCLFSEIKVDFQTFNGYYYNHLLDSTILVLFSVYKVIPGVKQTEDAQKHD